MKRPVPHRESACAVVTGLGALTAAGPGRAALEQQLASSTPHLSPVDRSPGTPPDPDDGAPPGRLAAQVGNPDLKPWLSPMAARRMSRPSKFAVVSAKLAIMDAGLESEDLDADSLAVVMATSFGPTDFSERILKSICADGPESTSPSLFTESVANAPAAQVALAFRAHGPNVTVTQREAGPLIALASATREVVEGRSTVALAGSVDEVAPVLHSALARFGALAGSRGGDPSVARPFDAHRDGFLLGEGACVLVVEREDRARARGAPILARVRWAASGFDPESPVTGWSKSPDRLARRLASRLQAANLSPDDIDGIVSGASGTRAGDQLEGQILQALWGERPLPPILAPKSVTGEYGGGHLAAAVLAASGAPMGPTAGFSQPDPRIDIKPHDGRTFVAPKRILVTSLAVGGAAAWMILESEGQDE